MNISLVSILAVLGRIDPAIWDVIVPMGPERGRAASVGDRVALNPQPLPPRELYAAAEVARQIAYAAAAAESAGNGEGAVNMVARAIDDFCGTHPWPRPWPGPLGGTDAQPDRVAEMRLVAALSMASTASRMADGEARQALTIGADKLAQAAVGQQTGEREHAIA